MTRKDWRPVVMTAGAVIILLMCWYSYTLYAISFFQSSLRAEHIEESVSLGARDYRVSDGIAYTQGAPVPALQSLKILELAYAKTLARNSPYLALAGVEPGSLDKAAAELAQAQDNLAALQKDAAHAEAVRSSLYPTGFLHSAAALERARIAFIASGSDADYRRYEAAGGNTVRAYLHDLQTFKNAFLRTVPSDAKNYYDSVYLVSRSDLLRALDMLRDGIAGIQTKISQRSFCLAGLIYTCDAADLRLPTLVPQKEKVIPESSLRTVDEISALYKWIRELNGLKLVTFQRIELYESSCTGAISDAPVFLMVKYPADNGVNGFTFPFFIGDLRFEKKSAGQPTGFNTFFYSRGTEYVLDSPMTHYTCLALEHDVARAFATHNTAAVAQEMPASAYARPIDAEKLQLFENLLTKGTGPIKETDATSYVALAAAVAPSAHTSATDAIESLVLQMRNNSGGFDTFVREIAWMENLNIKVLGKGLPVALEAPYLFYARSAFLGLFMSDNISFVGTHDAFFPPNNLPISEQPFVFYSKMPHTPSILDAVIRDISVYINLHVKTDYILESSTTGI